ncbi:MAG TPA: ergothioneine biosynthesis protein EgtB [Ideonella sp.]|uniref:ergothioneine biosynthesis protein EgtB n=1 Tax=Ideonella sp. TaxID=1929293 RepID=UPI002E2FC34A|nr:ergothioneine biosynthesis protein EgtB [Ideonella sp.]HEX5687756.1 ergothioneine biosynthesis protein EgtB [Ideonella sp.]
MHLQPTDDRRFASRATLASRLCAVRAHSLALAEPLSAEDQGAQSMPDASPTKWHLAHTTWLFETVVLQAFAPHHRPFDVRFGRLFNSYYESLGTRHPRPQRGLLTRPALAEVLAYRAHVDEALQAFIEGADADTWAAAAPLLELGLQHEQQHQELVLTDVLHLLSLNPLAPAYRPATPHAPSTHPGDAGWWECTRSEAEVGHDGRDGFAFDNEGPRHVVRLAPFALARALVTNREVQAFIADGGYRRPEFWLSDGWAMAQAQGWQAPLYWRDGERQFTLHSEQPIDPNAPACHLSFYEASALAAWAGARLPTEFEWEAAAHAWGATAPAGPGPLQPGPRRSGADAQCFGAVWQWTRSSYDPYPRFKPFAGTACEYNGKFMVGQLVLRGSSCATSPGHARLSYRNFFPPAARWQFSGLRLARDIDA